MAENQLNPTNRRGMALDAFSPQKLEVIKNTVAKGATDDELEMFLTLAGRYNLDPFLKEIWFIKRAKKQKTWVNNREVWDYKRLPNGDIDYSGAETIIMSSRDGYLKAARDMDGFLGIRSSEVKEGDDFFYDPVTQEIHHRITAKRGKVTAAWAIARRENREDVVIYVDYQEYANATGSNTYTKYPSAMIKKVAEVLALKKQFGLNGLVTQEEMSADYSLDALEAGPDIIDEKPDKPERKQAETYTEPTKTSQEPGKAEQPKRQPANSDDVKKKDWMKLAEKVAILRDELGINQETLIRTAVREFKVSDQPANWSLREIRKIKNFLEDELKRMERPPVTIIDGEKIIEDFEKKTNE